MDILIKTASAGLLVKGSRFLAELFPCKTAADARLILKERKNRYADATHVVHAFICGQGAEISGMSDDGEPSGTAGRPVLDVLKGRNCTDVIITVTRWFGGTLLGTGGLVKAYGDSAKKVIAAADSENLFETYAEKRLFLFSADYGQYEKIKRFMNQFKLYDVDERFESCVIVTGKIIADEYDAFCETVKNASAGKVAVSGK